MAPITRWGLLAGLLLVGAGTARAASRRAPGHAMPWDTFEALCSRWASTWALPPLILWVVATLESGRNPDDANTTDPRAVARGGAWGLFGMTLETARGLVRRAKSLRDLPVVGAWMGTGPELRRPELNAAIAGYYLGELWREFRDFTATLAAYHQGPATVRAIRARGGDVATEIGPKGRAYVAKGLSLRTEFEGRATA